MTYEIRFDGRAFGYGSYVYFLKNAERALSLGERRIEVNFDSIQFFYPDGMAPFIATTLCLINEGLSIGFTEPQNYKLSQYWESSGWYDGIKNTGQILPARSTYVPLTPILTSEDIHDFLAKAREVLATTEVFPEGILTAFEWAFYEISDNVLLHSNSSEPAWLQMTSYRDKQRVEFVVVDTGIGIRESLSESIPDLESDLQAVVLAVEKEITRNRDIGQGNGLSGTLKIASNANGWMNLHSGRGQLRWMRNHLRQKTVSNHPGTLVTVTLPTENPIDVSEALWGHDPVPAFESQYVTGEGVLFVVRNEASNFGNRFTGEKLRLKLRNIADINSQEGVIIDFEGVDVMSASFADEFIAKLVKELGTTSFFRRYQLRGLSRFAARTIDQVIAQRLAVEL